MHIPRACYELFQGARSPRNRPPAVLRLLAVAPLRRVAAPCIRPVPGAARPLKQFITGSKQKISAIIERIVNVVGWRCPYLIRQFTALHCLDRFVDNILELPG